MTTAAGVPGSDQTATDRKGSEVNAGGLHFLYFADPMCSWCYGFSPVIAQVAEHFVDRIPVRIVMGGLRPGTTQPMRPEDKDYIRGAWARVAEASGQPFDHAFFDRDGFVYDTEPACRAVVAMRTMAPGQALAFLARVSRAFYAEGRDTTDADVLCALAGEFEQDESSFRDAFFAADARNETMRDFLFSQQSGVTGFPCLVVGTGGSDYALVSNGFRPLDGLIEAVEGWLANQTGSAADA